MNHDPAIQMSGLSFQYEKSTKQDLHNINLSVPQGKIIAIMGETGAGKSTLLMTLNGIIPQFIEGKMEGSVLVQGSSTQEVPIQQLISKAGLVLQDTETQIFGLTVWEDTAFGPSNLGVPLDDIKLKVNNALQKVGLSGYEQRRTEFMSGGEKQRLAVAGVLAIGPSIVALDEPTSELDPEGKELIFQIVRQLQQEGMTIVIAEHESEQILAYADEVYVLQEGKLVWSGTPEQLFCHKQLASEFRLRPPGIASLYWELQGKGVDLGEACPRTADELVERLIQQLELVPLYQNASQLGTSAVTSPLAKQSSAESCILQIQDLHHSYSNGYEALQGITLDINEGDYIAIVGQNGAGKTTLCKHLNRLLAPTKGRILFQGENIAGQDTYQLAPHIGYVFQNPDHQIFCSSVLDEVTYGLKTLGMSKQEQRNKAMEVISFIGLEPYVDDHPFTLDKGLRQRLAIASILVLEPQVLIIDEPTAGLDWHATEQMLHMIRNLHQKGHTIITITHNMQIATEEANRVVIMSNGTILKDCAPLAIFTDEPIVQAAKLIPPQLVRMNQLLSRYIQLSPEQITAEELAAALSERMRSNA
ncbi:ABC transporter ATP-binding protein [Paenibacillus albiflavus]|uniref:ABC transporter ATP-binding protein n=1 Tax=Paenibacillus albiflavus TaxID=2545760 RepID=A0A4R4E8V3_9BACL|nr:ABC transporter ATP-binding protein [Paenibacillus albiflavus]TCZ75413.1 ABC transporter ATP-binding protein [Paenibacillus albiflavus]